MEYIKIVNSDDKLKIILNERLDNIECLRLIKERLEKVFVYSNKRKEVILEVFSRNFTSKEVLQLFDIFETLDNYLISKIISRKKIKEEIAIIKGNIRNGEVGIYDKSILFIGNINRGSKIICAGNLYVLGKINGEIEIINSERKIYCEEISNALVKIGGVYQIYTDNLYDQMIYLENNKMKNIEYRIGEKNNGKSDSCYIG